MTMRALDRFILVRQATIVAGRFHAVMGAQRLVAARLILLCVLVEIAEGGRQAVAAVLLRHTAQRPQRVLQAFRERYETFAAEHHMRMLEAGEHQPKVIEPMFKQRTRDHNPKRAHVGEVR